MHYHQPNQERALNLSILAVSGPGEVPRVESNLATDATPGGALPSIPLSFSCATIPAPEPRNFSFPESACRVIDAKFRRIDGWHRLWSELRRYLTSS